MFCSSFGQRGVEGRRWRGGASLSSENEGMSGGGAVSLGQGYSLSKTEGVGPGTEGASWLPEGQDLTFHWPSFSS